MATRRPTDVTDHMIDLIGRHKQELGLYDVVYGDQVTIPGTPLVAVEPARLQRPLEGLPYQVLNMFQISVIVYNTGLEGTETVQREADLVTQAVATTIDKDALPAQYGGTNFGGLLTYGHVEEYEFGYRVLADNLMRANRLIFAGRSKTGLIDG